MGLKGLSAMQHAQNNTKTDLPTTSPTWVAADQHTVEVENLSYRVWMQESRKQITVKQTVPAAIATQPIPPLSSEATSLITQANAAIKALESESIASLSTQTSDLANLSALLMRGEAVASSQIEHISTSNEALAVALADLDETGDAITPASATGTWLVAGAVETIQLALETPLVSANWFKSLHATLLADDPDIEKHNLGQWRQCAVWIGANRETAAFEAPPHNLIDGLITDLIAFCARSEIAPLVKAAIAHAQFELIHPFVDGNGRVGRALIQQLLNTAHVPVPVAQGLLIEFSAYIAGLGAYRRGELETWLKTFAKAVIKSCEAARDLIRGLGKLKSHFATLLPNSRAGSVPQRLLFDLITQPVVTSLMLQRRYSITAARASQICSQLNEAGVLHETTQWAPTRQKVWVATDVIALLDTFGKNHPRT